MKKTKEMEIKTCIYCGKIREQDILCYECEKTFHEKVIEMHKKHETEMREIFKNELKRLTNEKSKQKTI